MRTCAVYTLDVEFCVLANSIMLLLQILIRMNLLRSPWSVAKIRLVEALSFVDTVSMSFIASRVSRATANAWSNFWYLVIIIEHLCLLNVLVCKDYRLHAVFR